MFWYIFLWIKTNPHSEDSWRKIFWEYLLSIIYLSHVWAGLITAPAWINIKNMDRNTESMFLPSSVTTICSGHRKYDTRFVFATEIDPEWEEAHSGEFLTFIWWINIKTLVIVTCLFVYCSYLDLSDKRIFSWFTYILCLLQQTEVNCIINLSSNLPVRFSLEIKKTIEYFLVMRTFVPFLAKIL